MDSAAPHVLNASSQTAYARTVCVVCVCICLYLLANTHYGRVRRVSSMQSVHEKRKKSAQRHNTGQSVLLNTLNLRPFVFTCEVPRKETRNECTEERKAHGTA